MLMFDLLQSRYNNCKIKVQATGFEPARCVNTIRFPNERGNQFRLACKSKIHNGAIKVNCFSLTLINFIFSIPKILPSKIELR